MKGGRSKRRAQGMRNEAEIAAGPNRSAPGITCSARQGTPLWPLSSAQQVRFAPSMSVLRVAETCGENVVGRSFVSMMHVSSPTVPM